MAIDGVAELFSEQFTIQFPHHDMIEMICLQNLSFAD